MPWGIARYARFAPAAPIETPWGKIGRLWVAERSGCGKLIFETGQSVSGGLAAVLYVTIQEEAPCAFL